MKFSKKILAAAALAVASVSASAGTLYAFDITKIQQTITKPGDFVQIYDFYLDPVTFPQFQADVGFAFTELKFKSYTDITFSGLTLSDDSGVVWSGVPAPAGGTPADVISFDNVTVGSQHFQLIVAGTAIGTGPNSGSYSFEIAAAPVPEPETYGLALAGLLVAGTLAKRRSQRA